MPLEKCVSQAVLSVKRREQENTEGKGISHEERQEGKEGKGREVRRNKMPYAYAQIPYNKWIHCALQRYITKQLKNPSVEILLKVTQIRHMILQS